MRTEMYGRAPALTITRPFIAAYWSWAGVLQSLQSTRYYDLVSSVSPTALAPIALCLFALASHIGVGLLMSYLGCLRSRWGD